MVGDGEDEGIDRDGGDDDEDDEDTREDEGERRYTSFLWWGNE